LLDHKRATTHWSHGEVLGERFPAVQVDTNPIFIRDGNTWTSAGITASFDLLLALVEEDLGSEAARSIARTLVLFLRRTGNQAQFSTQLSTQLADRHPIRDLQQFIADHPEADLSLDALADRVNMSRRHFARVFTAEVGVTPGRYVERIRIETARRRLEESQSTVESVAVACGFGSGENLRRSFVHALGVSPAEYRRRFGTARLLNGLEPIPSAAR
jgi:transcriptional regulator GlxA family with amidase domain